MLEIFDPEQGVSSQVAENDIGEVDWYYAKIACRKLGSGWRVPFISELEQIFEELYKKGKGNFESEYYWSDEENYFDNGFGFDFCNGNSFEHLKCSLCNVRAVRYLE